MRNALAYSEACERNKQPILEVLGTVLPASGRVLEIGSGTGQHVVHFARALPRIEWQPSDRKEYLADLAQRLEREGAPNIQPALELDVGASWPDGPFAAVYSANTAHIMSWGEVRDMFEGVGRVLAPGGVFCLYGPFNEDGAFTAPSNAAFDHQLRQRDPHMGLRDLRDLESLARAHRMTRVNRFMLPANNQLLVFARATGGGPGRTT